MVRNADDGVLSAVEISIAGNIIDYAAKNTLNIDEEIERLFSGHLPENTSSVFDYDLFREDLDKAQTVLILGDNAGKIVFDRILVEEIGGHKTIHYAVRGRPILNDATVEDARMCGMDRIAHVFSSGVASPGTILEECSDEFLKIFYDADLVLSKGQGNYEALY